MNAYARLAGVLGIAALGIAGCAQHATPMDLDVETIDEPPRELMRHARARTPGPEPLPQRCTAADDSKARPIGADEGWERSTLRVQTEQGLQELPLQESSFETLVVGTVAETLVTQVFANPFDAPIEAVYAFPLHERAAVDDYWIHVGDRSLHGEIRRRDEAKKIYEDAKAQGRRAGLLEQERPNVFTQSVANILPGESIQVQMHVVQPLDQEDGRSSLTLPTVVGPRYVQGSPISHTGTGVSPDTDLVPDGSKVTPPILDPKRAGCAPLVISVDIEAGVPVSGLKSANHAISRTSANGVTTVELSSGATVANRDFELSWVVAGDRTQASVMTQADEGSGGTFTLTIVPPASLTAQEAVPRDLVFVVDNSGSMSGKPMQTAKAVMRQAIASMGPDDRFTVLRFSEEASALSPGLLANTAENRDRGLAYVEQMHGMGGTHMRAGIEAALGLAQAADRVPMVLLLTDGYIGREAAVFELVAQQLGRARIFGLGVGDAPNRHLLGGVSRVGRGAASYVGIDEAVDEAVDRFYRRIARPALTDIEVDWGELPVAEVVPSRIPDLFVGQPLVLYGTFESADSGTVVIEGRQGQRAVSFSVDVELDDAASGTGLRSMWARSKIEELLRDPFVYQLDAAAQEKRRERAIELSLSHRVLTEYTAYVAVDAVRASDAAPTTVAVPVEPVRGMSLQGRASPQQGTIGLGNVGVIGKGAGAGSGAGYGRGAGAGFHGRGKRVPRIRRAKAVVTGSLDKDVIRRVVRKHQGAMRACYEPVLASDPKRIFRLVVAFVIDAQGAVEAALEWSETPQTEAEKTFERCLSEALERMRFPKPAGGGTVTVRYPLVFEPQ